jgi:Ca2+-binding EF-hand superfamily protein
LIQISVAIYALLGCNVSPAHDLKTCEEHANKVFGKLDVQRNGYITFEQFMEICIKVRKINYNPYKDSNIAVKY